MRSMTLFNFLLEATLIGSALVLVMLALRSLLRGRASNRVLYALWLVVALRLLLPISLPNPLMNDLRPTWSTDEAARPVADQIRTRFLDTVDALASHQSRERKLEILKDSNCGAFAVMYAMLWLLMSFGVFSGLYELGLVWPVCPLFVLSRALSGLCALNIPSARRSGMLGSLTKNTRRFRGSLALVCWAVPAAAGMLWLSPLSGLCGLLAAALWVFAYYRTVMKQFGGVTGDTAGFFLQLCELLVPFALWMGGLLV